MSKQYNHNLFSGLAVQGQNYLATATGSNVMSVNEIVMCNTTGNAVAANVYHMFPGVSVSKPPAARMLLANLPIPAFGTASPVFNALALQPGESLMFNLSSGSGLAVNIYGAVSN